MRSAEYQRGYDAGYKQALLDALKQRPASTDLGFVGRDPHWRLDEMNRKIGGPDSPFKPRGVPGSIYND